jgi:hypothetical protein
VSSFGDFLRAAAVVSQKPVKARLSARDVKERKQKFLRRFFFTLYELVPPAVVVVDKIYLPSLVSQVQAGSAGSTPHVVHSSAAVGLDLTQARQEINDLRFPSTCEGLLLILRQRVHFPEVLLADLDH